MEKGSYALNRDDEIRLRAARDVIPTLEKICIEMARRQGREFPSFLHVDESNSVDVYNALAERAKKVREFFPGIRFF